MKTLHIVHQYLPDVVGGTELYTHWLAHAWARRGYETAVFYRRSQAGRGLEARIDDDGVRVWAAWSGEVTPRSRFLATFRDKDMLAAFDQVLAEVQPELVHIQHLMGLPVAVIDRIRRLNIPFVVTLEDYWWICANAQLLTNYDQTICDGPRAYRNCARCALARANRPNFWPAIPPLVALLARRNSSLRGVLNAAQTLIAPTEFVREWYVARGVPAPKIKVIPHGLDIPPQQPKREPQAGRSFRFAYIGGLSPQKGVHNLVQAFHGLEERAELWIAGDELADPAYVAQLKAAAGNRVKFLGKLSREAVWQTLAQVDVLVVTSIWYETFCIIISEAFAAGVPVVVSRLGPLADRVDDGVDGLLVEPDHPQALRQTLARFLDEPELVDKLRQGIKPVYTVEQHVEEIEKVYHSVSSR